MNPIKTLFFVILFALLHTSVCGQIFKVCPAESVYWRWHFEQRDYSDSRKYYSFSFIKDSTCFPIEFSRANLSFTRKDTLAMIEQLLTFEHDRRLYYEPIVLDPRVSQFWYRSTDYTLDVQALYLINKLFFTSDHVLYARGPALSFTAGKGSPYNTPEAVLIAYRNYRRWFKKVKILGLPLARKLCCDPLRNSGVTWF